MSTRKPPRQMAAKACERCRRRKIKCDEYYPCGQCTKMRVTCKIEDPAEKRREQQQSVMEDRIKRLEALLVATYTNPNNRLDMNIPGLDQEGLLPNSVLGASPGPSSSSQGMKPEPPRLTLQTPATQDFMSTEPSELLSTSDFSFGVPYWSPPSSIAPSVPASASDYFGSDPPPWSTTVTAGNSGDSTPPNQRSRRNSRVRASSLSASEPSTQDEILGSPIGNDRNRFSIDTSGSTLGIPQIEVTSWDQSRPQTPAIHSPALSPASMIDLGEMTSFYPPELSVGSWSGLSSPSIMAPSFQFEDNLLVVNQSLPSHSRRSSLNSLAPDYDAYNEPKRRRATSDVFPVPQQFVYPEGDLTDSPYCTTPVPTTSGLQSSLPQTQLPMQESPAKSDLFNRTFCEVVYPLFPILSPQSMPRNPTQNFSQTPSSSTPHMNHSCLSPEIAQTQSLLIRAISSYILCRRSSQNTLPAQNYFAHGLHAHGVGKWDSLPGIQTGILLAVFILISGCQGPNLYILNANIVAACLDLGLHKGGSNTGSLEANTLLAAYVLDRTVSLVRDRPSLLKDEDMERNTLAMVKNQLREMVERGRVRRWPEGGRLWDWWAEYEVKLRQGHLDIDLAAALGGQQLDTSFGFTDM